MTAWLNYAWDEVERFHPEFESAAQKAVAQAGLSGQYEWVHHLRTPGNTLIPDFVLRNTNTHKWALALEIKRTPDAVLSIRNQMQAKSYAEAGQQSYPSSYPRYFAISNLEVTILFALNGDHPPIECRIQDGVFKSGEFANTPSETHQKQLAHDLTCLITRVVKDRSPAFDIVWPRILGDFNAAVNSSVALTPVTFTESGKSRRHPAKWSTFPWNDLITLNYWNLSSTRILRIQPKATPATS